ncbi:MAG: hypothetical protein GKR97_07935 [Rhizobiaceae bacterium]|nr:hypothetical protein [Rhizobiaceae bacterium]
MSFLTNILKSGMAIACGMAIIMVGGSASASDYTYFKNVQGKWSGAGQIVAGPYKNTRFTCNLEGQTPGRAGMKLAGTCRVGLFSQQIEATVTKRGRSYRGKFLDGAKGKGLDIVSGRLRGQKLVLGIKRKQLRGTMTARLKGKNKMNITIAVRVNGGLTPFIGLSLDRKNGVRKTSFLTD